MSMQSRRQALLAGAAVAVGAALTAMVPELAWSAPKGAKTRWFEEQRSRVEPFGQRAKMQLPRCFSVLRGR